LSIVGCIRYFKIDPTVTESYLGWINGSYSLAQVIAAIIFGHWCDKRPSIEPLLLSPLLIIIGSCLYSYGELFGVNGVYVVLAARVLQGFGAGTIAVARTVCADLSTLKTRASILAKLATAQAAGFFVGPALQAIVQPIGSKGVHIPGINFSLNIMCSTYCLEYYQCCSTHLVFQRRF